MEYYAVDWDTSENFNSAAMSSVILDGDDFLLEEQVRETALGECFSFDRGI